MAEDNKAKGTMFFDENILDAYNLAKDFAGQNGKVATMSDIVAAKVEADSMSLLWTKYVTTPSGEFYGRSKGGIPIVVVAQDISKILQDGEIMQRSLKDLRKCSLIQLTPREFQGLETGFYGPVKVLELSNILAMREYPTSVLSYGEACDEDPLLLARLGTDAEHLYLGSDALKFLKKHSEITLKESGNVFILTNDHKYPYKPVENTGGLLGMSQLINNLRCGGEPSSVSSDIHVSDLSCAARFVSMDGTGRLGEVNTGLESIFDETGKNWKTLSVPNEGGKGKDLYVLQRKGGRVFTQYKEKGDIMNSGVPEFHVRRLRKVGRPDTFVTPVLGYYGLFKYKQESVERMCPCGANAYFMGQPELVDGHTEKQKAPIQFYFADVDTSRRILRDKEVKKDMGMVRKLLGK